MIVADIGDVASGAIDRGEVLIAGMAAMLITIFLGPKFIEWLRLREFGQQIREEGPQEHRSKAGTPTMGGLILFLAIAVPYLVLSKRDTASLAVFGVAVGCAALGFADDFIKISKRRSLGLSARVQAARRRSPSRSRCGGSPTTSSGSTRCSSRGSSTPDPHRSGALPDLHLPGDRRGLERGQPHRRARRARRGLLRDRPARLHGDHDHQRPGRPRAARRLLRRRLDRVPLVQRLPGLDLHGRHRVARLRGCDRRLRGHDPDRAAADHPRRDLRDRGALGRRSR